MEEGNITEKKRKIKEGMREKRERKEKERKGKEEKEKGRRTGCSPSIFIACGRPRSSHFSRSKR